MKREKGNAGFKRKAELQEKVQKRTGAALAFAAMLLLVTGCGASGDSSYKSELGMTNQYSQSTSSYNTAGGSYISSDSYQESYDMDMDMAPEEEAGTADNADITDGRKMVETVRLDVETKEFDQMMSVLETQVRKLGGYIENMETYNGSSYSSYSSSRYANLTIRIPSKELSGFLDTVSDVGNVVRRTSSQEDVTLTYVDMESRRDMLQAEQARLLEFMDRAETMEDIITIEQRLSEVRYQLESMESRLRSMDNLVDYGTVHMSISEVRELTPVAEQTVWERISEGFMGSLYSIRDGITEFGIWFFINIPYLLIWAAVIAVIVLILRKCNQAQARKREAQFKADQEKLQEFEQRRRAAEQAGENKRQP